METFLFRKTSESVLPVPEFFYKTCETQHYSKSTCHNYMKEMLSHKTIKDKGI